MNDEEDLDKKYPQKTPLKPGTYNGEVLRVDGSGNGRTVKVKRKQGKLGFGHARYRMSFHIPFSAGFKDPITKGDLYTVNVKMTNNVPEYQVQVVKQLAAASSSAVA